MINNEEFEISLDEKATLVSIVCDKFEHHQTAKKTEHSLNELNELLRTLGVETGSQHIQNRTKVDPATMLGIGKLEEIAIAARNEGSSILVFDFELTASQMRNIKKANFSLL